MQQVAIFQPTDSCSANFR